MSARIVMITSATALTDPRVLKEADALAGAGHEVVVLAWDRAAKAEPTIAMNGWTLENLGPRAVHGAGLRNVGRYRAWWRDATRRVVELEPDVIHCHNLDSVPIALRAMRRRHRAHRRPLLVADFHEIYRESRALPQRGIAGVVARAAARYLERRSIPRADLVITVVEAQASYYRNLRARTVLVVENAPDQRLYTPVEREAPEFVVSFVGQKRWLPSLENLMRAVQSLPMVKVLLVGGGPAEQQVAQLASTMERVEVHGTVDPADIPALYRRSDAVWCCYDATLLNWRTSFPVKSMEAMASALPILCTRGTWIADYVERNGLGIVVDDTDVADIARALTALESDREVARAMGRRGREIVERELNWGVVSQRLVGAYKSLVGDRAVSIE